MEADGVRLFPVFQNEKIQFPTTRKNVNNPKTQRAQNRKTHNVNAETTNDARAVNSEKRKIQKGKEL
jgi:hypothetical protein